MCLISCGIVKILAELGYQACVLGHRQARLIKAVEEVIGLGRP
jgi:hypothetical protein